MLTHAGTDGGCGEGSAGERRAERPGGCAANVDVATWRTVVTGVADPLVAILVVASAVAYAVGEVADAVIIDVAISLSSSTGTWR